MTNGGSDDPPLAGEVAFASAASARGGYPSTTACGGGPPPPRGEDLWTHFIARWRGRGNAGKGAGRAKTVGGRGGWLGCRSAAAGWRSGRRVCARVLANGRRAPGAAFRLHPSSPVASAAPGSRKWGPCPAGTDTRSAPAPSPTLPRGGGRSGPAMLQDTGSGDPAGTAAPRPWCQPQMGKSGKGDALSLPHPSAWLARHIAEGAGV